jgi:hypothetical protein
MSSNRYAKILARVDRLRERRLPMRVIHQARYPGEPDPEWPPSDPNRLTVRILTRYLSREETEAEIRCDREHGHYRPDPP